MADGENVAENIPARGETRARVLFVKTNLSRTMIRCRVIEAAAAKLDFVAIRDRIPNEMCRDFTEWQIARFGRRREFRKISIYKNFRAMFPRKFS